MKMRNKLLISTLAAIAITSSATAKDFNASIWFPDAHPLTKYGYLDWAPKLKEATNGSLEARVFTGDVLLPPAGHLTGVRDGIAQVAYHAGTYTPAELPIDNVLAQIAFSYSDYFVAAFAITDMNMTDPETIAQWAKHNIVFGGGYATPPYQLICSSKVETLEDIKGKKLRVAGAAHSDWVKSVGAVPVNVPSSEMYNGLDKGQIDCAANATNDLKSRSLWDVAKHVTTLPLGVYWAGYQYGINKDFWQSLTSEERRAMLGTIAEAMVHTGIGYQAAADEGLAEAPEHGVTVYKPGPELQKSVDDFAKHVRDNAITLGKEKFGLEDPEGLIARFEERAEKWRRLLAEVDRNDTTALIALARQELFDKIDVESYGMN